MYENDYLSTDLPEMPDLSELSENGRAIVLKHYGIKRRSGRYPYGSGKKWAQRDRADRSPAAFYEVRKRMRADGLTDNDIAKELGMSTTEYRSMVTMANAEMKQRMAKEIKSAVDHGVSRAELAEKYGVSLATVDNYLKADYTTINRARKGEEIRDTLKMKALEGGYLDVGAGVEIQLGISRERMRSTIKDLVESGEFEVMNVRVPQASNDWNKTTVQLLVPAGTDIRDVYSNLDKIRPVDFTFSGGYSDNIQNNQTPKSIDWNRVEVKYAIPSGERGHGTERDGGMMDGVMLIRPGVADLDMGGARYAQVRIAVGDTHYLKGMAMYGEASDFKKGVDVIFNTNKTKDIPVQEVLKKLDGPLDGPNPFGATIKRQAELRGPDGQPVYNMSLTKKIEKAMGKKLGEPIKDIGAINIVNEEGDWSSWSKALSSQFLSKQPTRVVHEHLKKTLKGIDQDYKEIMAVDNPVIRKKLLETHIQSLEAKQVHLKAQAPKGFQGHVLLPVPKMKENEVFAPNYKDGERVILVRYPHAGRFEIPELIVNNRGPGRKVVGPNSKDAIGIHPKVAMKLSGADFDGDTAYVIPNSTGKFKSQKTLAGLRGFDPSDYKDPGKTFKIMPKKSIGLEMGQISNLITDMTLRGASSDELARAVKHSMVVIDAHKHKLNYKRSEEENGIKALKKKYQEHTVQIDYSKLERYNPATRKTEKVTDPAFVNKKGKTSKGAATIVSQSKQEVATGGKLVEIVDKNGKQRTVLRGNSTSHVITMLKDASVYLDSKSSPVEKEYVSYVNELKSRVTEASKEKDKITIPKRNAKAAAVYKDEVDSLNNKFKISLLNQPKERQAQSIARKRIQEEVERQGGRESIDGDRYNKIKQQAIKGARDQVGAKRSPVTITSIEWDAIQAGAISATKLESLVRHMDSDQLKQLATPRTNGAVSDNVKSRAKSMLANGYTIAEVSSTLGISKSTIASLDD